jgi:hypothetical protein
MKATWDRDDYRSMAQNGFHFSGDQSRQLAIRYGAPAQADLSPRAASTTLR